MRVYLVFILFSQIKKNFAEMIASVESIDKSRKSHIISAFNSKALHGGFNENMAGVPRTPHAGLTVKQKTQCILSSF